MNLKPVDFCESCQSIGHVMMNCPRNTIRIKMNESVVTNKNKNIAFAALEEDNDDNSIFSLGSEATSDAKYGFSASKSFLDIDEEENGCQMNRQSPVPAASRILERLCAAAVTDAAHTRGYSGERMGKSAPGVRETRFLTPDRSGTSAAGTGHSDTRSRSGR